MVVLRRVSLTRSLFGHSACSCDPILDSASPSEALSPSIHRDAGTDTGQYAFDTRHHTHAALCPCGWPNSYTKDIIPKTCSCPLVRANILHLHRDHLLVVNCIALVISVTFLGCGDGDMSLPTSSSVTLLSLNSSSFSSSSHSLRPQPKPCEASVACYYVFPSRLSSRTFRRLRRSARRFSLPRTESAPLDC